MKQAIRRLTARAIAKLPRGLFTDKEHFPIYQAAGFHITPNHFYHPIPNTEEIDPAIWDRPSEMAGVDKNVASQISLLSELAEHGYFGEYQNMPPVTGFDGMDGAMLYALIRKHKPQRIVEIGSGASTLTSLAALKANNNQSSMVAVEPYPKDYLRKLDIRLIESCVERLPLSTFSELESDDILFIDSSHTVRIDGDVLFEILEILPRLKPGVLVHIHDIFLPMHYSKEWTLNERIFWTEQYLVQAFLAFNPSYKIIWGAGIMAVDQLQLLHQHFANFDRLSASSLWLRRT